MNCSLRLCFKANCKKFNSNELVPNKYVKESNDNKKLARFQQIE